MRPLPLGPVVDVQGAEAPAAAHTEQMDDTRLRAAPCKMARPLHAPAVAQQPRRRQQRQLGALIAPRFAARACDRIVPDHATRLRTGWNYKSRLGQPEMPSKCIGACPWSPGQVFPDEHICNTRRSKEYQE
eukprot:6205950-Pleurochrysis_carterae.AAC.2